MPITPHGSPGDLPGMLGERTALVVGAIMLLGGLLVTLVAGQLLDGLMLGGFGLALLGWGGLQARPEQARLFLGLGVLGGLVAFGAALVVVAGS
jgi:hypothetical protein